MMLDVELRDVTESDVLVFFEQQRDPTANHMAAFTAKDPADKGAFAAKWTRIRGDEAITKKTVLFEGRAAGNVVAFVAPWSGKPEVSYWLGKEFWGKGIATTALKLFLTVVTTRPLYARAAKDHAASIRVLEKCGFTISGSARGFANARDAEVEEVILELKGKTSAVVTMDRVADLSESDSEDIRRLSLAVYPPEQIIDWPERQVDWSIPEWCVRLRSEDGELLSFVGVYVRVAECDGLPLRLGGVGNVKTHPQARGQGLAAIGIQRAVEFFIAQPGIVFALLVCEPQLLGYYARLGWQEFGGRLLVRQQGISSDFTFNRVMIYSVRIEQSLPGTIDLCGLPW